MDKSLGLLLLENEMEYIGIQERLILNMRVKKKKKMIETKKCGCPFTLKGIKLLTNDD